MFLGLGPCFRCGIAVRRVFEMQRAPYKQVHFSVSGPVHNTSYHMHLCMPVSNSSTSIAFITVITMFSEWDTARVRIMILIIRRVLLQTQHQKQNMARKMPQTCCVHAHISVPPKARKQKKNETPGILAIYPQTLVFFAVHFAVAFRDWVRLSRSRKAALRDLGSMALTATFLKLEIQARD